MTHNRGPEDPSVLYLQTTHMSSIISHENIDDIIKVKRSDNLVWNLYTEIRIHNRVLIYLHNMGIYGVLQCGSLGFDNHLITALVERWRRETHTFHFRCGEATITLQDVSVIWGLPIDGIPVTGVDDSRTVVEWQHICNELLGFTPAASYFKGSHLSMTALYEHCTSNPIDNYSLESDVVKYTRCVALMIISGIMFPDYQGGSARLMFLQLLRDIEDVKSYSWGSAVLAFLYRELCNATRIGKSTMAGPLYILQIWAWSRIKCVNPDRTGITADVPPSYPNDIVPVAPWGARWQTGFRYTHAPTHSVRIIRHCFDQMDHNSFNWTVYKKNDTDVKAITDSYNNKLWRCVCPLICFEIVEMHRPNRVIRQFKRRQSIPDDALDNDQLHNITRIGHRNIDWRAYHHNAIILWDQRLRFVAQGVRIGGMNPVQDNYFDWYERITVRTLSPSAQGVGFQPVPQLLQPTPHHIQQDFSAVSPFSQLSEGEWDYNIGGTGSGFTSFAGTSNAWGFGAGQSSGFGAGQSSGFGAGPTGGFSAGHTGGFSAGQSTSLFDHSSTWQFGSSGGAGPSFVDQGYQTPFGTNFQSQSYSPPHQQIPDMRPPRPNILSPVYYPEYSNADNTRAVLPRRGRRRRNPPACGTGSHLYHRTTDDDSSD